MIWTGARAGIVLALVAAAGVGLARDSRHAGAVTTEIVPSLSATSPTTVTSQILVKGAQPGDDACVAAVPTGRCIYVWAKNVNNQTGASAFSVGATYPSSGLQMRFAQVGAGNWLGSTGRSISCPTSVNNPGYALVGCSSLTAPPPFGPNCPSHCNGLLAKLSVVSTDQIGSYTLNLSPIGEDGQVSTYLLDTPAPDQNGNIPFARIPATVSSMTLVVAPCADYNNDNTIRVNDIVYVVHKYFTSDVPADLNGDGMVRVSDIIIAVGEYFVDCVSPDW